MFAICVYVCVFFYPVIKLTINLRHQFTGASIPGLKKQAESMTLRAVNREKKKDVFGRDVTGRERDKYFTTTQTIYYISPGEYRGGKQKNSRYTREWNNWLV